MLVVLTRRLTRTQKSQTLKRRYLMLLDSRLLLLSYKSHWKTENKITDKTNLATKAALNTKAGDVKSKTPGITNLATKAALNKKATETEKKYIW